MEEARSPTPNHDNRQRLPNLFEVLSRRTLAPAPADNTGFAHMMAVDDATPANLMDSGLTILASVDDGQLEESPELKQNIRQLMKKLNIFFHTGRWKEISWPSPPQGTGALDTLV